METPKENPIFKGVKFIEIIDRPPYHARRNVQTSEGNLIIVAQTTFSYQAKHWAKELNAVIAKVPLEHGKFILLSDRTPNVNEVEETKEKTSFAGSFKCPNCYWEVPDYPNNGQYKINGEIYPKITNNRSYSTMESVYQQYEWTENHKCVKCGTEWSFNQSSD